MLYSKGKYKDLDKLLKFPVSYVELLKYLDKLDDIEFQNNSFLKIEGLKLIWKLIWLRNEIQTETSARTLLYVVSLKRRKQKAFSSQLRRLSEGFYTKGFDTWLHCSSIN